jgi:hypothetical protein
MISLFLCNIESDFPGDNDEDGPSANKESKEIMVLDSSNVDDDDDGEHSYFQSHKASR